MSGRPLFRMVRGVVTALTVVSLAAVLFGLIWDYSERRYLKGFAEAVVPYSSSPEEKVETILAWMQRGPARRNTPASGPLAESEPEETLNYEALLRACGSATNAFVNLAVSSGLHARRLLLLDERGRTKHVVAEVFLDNRWVVADPAYRTLMQDSSGHLLSKEQLRDPSLFQDATRGIVGYDSAFTYEKTTHLRLSRLPLLGGPLQSSLNRNFPGWGEALNWSYLVQRSSLSWAFSSMFLFCFSLLCRFTLNRYGERRLGITRVRLRDQLARASGALFGNSR